MRIFRTKAALLAITAICLVGCGDKVKADAEEKWGLFKVKEETRIRSETEKGNPIPHNFSFRFSEIENTTDRFTGFISFRRGNSSQERSYAFARGKWQPVDYKDEDELKEMKDKTENIQEKIGDLTKEIREDREFLENCKARSEDLQKKKNRLSALQKELADLKN